ncbi:uncharacterized protein FYW61_015021 [Anableps anableps]
MSVKPSSDLFMIHDEVYAGISQAAERKRGGERFKMPSEDRSYTTVAPGLLSITALPRPAPPPEPRRHKGSSHIQEAQRHFCAETQNPSDLCSGFNRSRQQTDGKQPEMGLLNITLLVLVLLTTTAAKPIRHRHDADIPDKHQPQRYLAELSEGSEESSEEESSEEESEEEEEEGVVEVTEAVTVPPLLVVTTDSTTVTSGDSSTLAPEPDTANTVGPVIMVRETTPEPAVTGVTVDVTTADVIQTSVRATEMRGDI